MLRQQTGPCKRLEWWLSKPFAVRYKKNKCHKSGNCQRQCKGESRKRGEEEKRKKDEDEDMKETGDKWKGKGSGEINHRESMKAHGSFTRQK